MSYNYGNNYGSNPYDGVNMPSRNTYGGTEDIGNNYGGRGNDRETNTSADGYGGLSQRNNPYGGNPTQATPTQNRYNSPSDPYSAGRQQANVYGQGRQPQQQASNYQPQASTNPYSGSDASRYANTAADPSGGDVEMQPIGAQQNGRQDPNLFDDSTNQRPLPNFTSEEIPQRCRQVIDALDDLELGERMPNGQRAQTSAFKELAKAPSRFAQDNDVSMEEITAQIQEIKSKLKFATSQLKRIKAQQTPATKGYVRQAEMKLDATGIRFQQIESDLRRIRESKVRQYEIANPNCTADELKAVEQDFEGDGNIFQQALQTSNRRGQVQSTLNNVQKRHKDVKYIETQMHELSQLFMQAREQVEVQDPTVGKVEQNTEHVADSVVQGNVSLTKGIESARTKNKWKWIGLWVCVAIVIVIAIIVVIYGATHGWFSHSSK